MSDAGEPVEHGQSLLGRISTEMVRAQKRFFGKGPTQARSYFLDDMLIVVMKGGLTTAELAMSEFGEHQKVREVRQVFEERMTQHLSELIEGLTGRTVLTYHSQVLFAPDRVLAIFVFDDQAASHLIKATASGQLRAVPAAEVDPSELDTDDPADR